MCCDVGLVSELRLTAGCVLMELASLAVSETSVYASGLKAVSVNSTAVLSNAKWSFGATLSLSGLELSSASKPFGVYNTYLKSAEL